jgi:hypothetical protein
MKSRRNILITDLAIGVRWEKNAILRALGPMNDFQITLLISYDKTAFFVSSGEAGFGIFLCLFKRVTNCGKA